MKILKFGGTSVSSALSIQNIRNILETKNEQTLVVVSALSGVTNLLKQSAELAANKTIEYKNKINEIKQKHLLLTEQILPIEQKLQTNEQISKLILKLDTILSGIENLGELTNRSIDLILSFGERMSSVIIYEYLILYISDVSYIDSSEIIKTAQYRGKEQVLIEETYRNIKNNIPPDKRIILAPGFIASSINGYPTTLGRGGSDYTAALYAAALNAKELEIWTDVSGIYTADPNMVTSAYPVKQMSYHEALELSHFGAKVIYSPTIYPVLEKNINIHIKNTFAPNEPGTLICDKSKINGSIVKAFSSIDKIALATLSGNAMAGVAEVASRLFNAMVKYDVKVKLITQASSEHSICFAIKEKDKQSAIESVAEEFEREISKGVINNLEINPGFAIIAMVGEGMKNSVSLSGRALSALGRNGVNIHAIAQGSSELNVSVVIKNTDCRKALNVLHESFFLSDYRAVNLFIIGIGNVGRAFLNQIKEQSAYFYDEYKIKFRIAGVANSKKMLFAQKGLEGNQLEEELKSKGVEMEINKFVTQAAEMNLRNSIFIDNTASEHISAVYQRFLSNNISVVTCNKIAASSDYENYLKLKTLAKKRNVFFRFESNVGAGLPIINTINNLVKSGDKIQRIEAVLSGSLNFIFNRFHQGVDFYTAVKEAMQQGFTEPDPRIDLSGKDVMRKLLILMRESHIKADVETIKQNNFLPEKLMEIDRIDAFLQELNKQADYFEQIKAEAEKESKRLRFVAKFDQNNAEVGLQAVNEDNPFYQLDGKDNIIAIYSRYYNDFPLVIRGAGAGAEVTASGIFSDVISILNS